MAADRIRLVRDAASGVEAISARFAGHAYDLHRHADWLVGVTRAGVQEFHCRGARRRSTPGRVILMEPEEAHDGAAGAPGGFAYAMLYLPQPWLAAALPGAAGFRTPLVEDAALATAIRRAVRALAAPLPRLMRDAALDAVAQALRPQLGAPPAAAAGRDRGLASRARAVLHARMAEDIGADALAAAAGAADRFRLARAFRAAHGVAPHAYLVQLRLLEAKRRLAAGEAPAEVAAACGFADQSHLGRWFRRAYGVTPGAYRACCTGVPDSAAAA
jgi:AraC-like DNA-binding protein